MRYTRYEYKKSGKMKFILSVAFIAAISIAAGMYGSKIIFNQKADSGIQRENSSKQNVVKSDGKRIIAIQCGYYANIDNAQSAVSLISGTYNSFIVEEDDKYRVMAGIYDYDNGVKKIDELTSKGIANTKIEFLIPEDTDDNKTILEIIDGFLKITDKLNDSSVKSIKTADYKAWALKVLGDNGNEKLECFQNVSSYINDMPDEIDNNNSKESLKKSYELIKKYKIVR